MRMYVFLCMLAGRACLGRSSTRSSQRRKRYGIVSLDSRICARLCIHVFTCIQLDTHPYMYKCVCYTHTRSISHVYIQTCVYPYGNFTPALQALMSNCLYMLTFQAQHPRHASNHATPGLPVEGSADVGTNFRSGLNKAYAWQ